MDESLTAPEWNRRKANALILAQAARLEALADLLERKQIITRGELADATVSILQTEKARLIASMIGVDQSASESPEV